jgi:type VI secretion system protein ImpF
MTSSLQSERFRPYLLRRLTDLHPQVRSEQYSTAVSVEEIKQDIYNNLLSLFNSSSHLSEDELRYPEVRSSVLGFGLSDYSVRAMSNADREKLRQEITNQIKNFEPRIEPESLGVEIIDNKDGYSASMSFRLTARIRINELNEELLYLSHFNVETGMAELETQSRG